MLSVGCHGLYKVLAWAAITGWYHDRVCYPLIYIAAGLNGVKLGAIYNKSSARRGAVLFRGEPPSGDGKSRPWHENVCLCIAKRMITCGVWRVYVTMSVNLS